MFISLHAQDGGEQTGSDGEEDENDGEKTGSDKEEERKVQMEMTMTEPH